MIIPIEMYGCKCDNCGIQWLDENNGFTAFTDEISMRNIMGDDSEWLTQDDKHYCSKCFSFDDEDNLILTSIKND